MPLPSRELVRRLLRYDRRTGDLIWKPRPREMFPSDWAWTVWNKRFPGTVAGTDLGNRLEVAIYGEHYYAHRIVWLIVRGEPVPRFIDHRDRDGYNNRIGNLRAATQAQNLANAKLRVDNTSGVKGVGPYRNGRFYARIVVDGVLHHLGHHDTLEAATAARHKAAKRLLGKFLPRDQ